MSDHIADITTEEKPAPVKSINKGKLGLIIITLVSILFIGMISFGYFQLAHVNISLARMVTNLANQTVTSQQQVVELQKSVDALQQSAQKSQSDEWYAIEAQYLVRIASDHLQFTHNDSLAISLLQRADQALQSSQDSHVMEVRKSLANDIAAIQAAPETDISALFLQLSALNNQVAQLPLPANPLQNDNAPTVTTSDQTDMPWWKVGLQRSLQALRQIVVVKQYRPDASPLVLPDEKAFLYQNLHAQLEAAMWGALHRNNDVYQASMQNSLAWTQQYFDQSSPATKSMLQTLKELQKLNLQPQVASLSATSALLDAYIKNR